MFNIFSFAERYIYDVVHIFNGLVDLFLSPVSKLLNFPDDIPIISDFFHSDLFFELFNFSLFEFMFVAGLPVLISFLTLKFVLSFIK